MRHFKMQNITKALSMLITQISPLCPNFLFSAENKWKYLSTKILKSDLISFVQQGKKQSFKCVLTPHHLESRMWDVEISQQKKKSKKKKNLTYTFQTKPYLQFLESSKVKREF